jgi:hypothetical protein
MREDRCFQEPPAIRHYSCSCFFQRQIVTGLPARSSEGLCPHRERLAER